MNLRQPPAERNRLHKTDVAAAIARLGSSNMNDTKWFEFFEIALALGISKAIIKTKMVFNDEPAKETWLRTVNPRWTDSFQGPFLNSEIEWIEFSGDDSKKILSKLHLLGPFPIVELNDGFRLLAYGPITIIREEKEDSA